MAKHTDVPMQLIRKEIWSSTVYGGQIEFGDILAHLRTDHNGVEASVQHIKHIEAGKAPE